MIIIANGRLQNHHRAEHQTVMAHYEVPPRGPEGYQSEAALERDFIQQLMSQGYENAKVKDEAGLLRNLRRQLELLNDIGNHRDGSLDPHSHGSGDGSLIQKEDQSPQIRVQA